jgi:hypothetical protein
MFSKRLSFIQCMFYSSCSNGNGRSNIKKIRIVKYLFKKSLINKEYSETSNGIWNIIVAITTVGYGDFYAATHVGRFITIMSVFSGTLIISLTVVTLTQLSTFSENEQKSSDIINRLDDRQTLNDACQSIIYNAFKIKEIRDKKDKRTLEDENEFSRLMQNFSDCQKKAFSLREEIKAFTFASDIDKIDEIAENLNTTLNRIYKNLTPLNSIKRKIKFQTQKMKKLQNNVAECLTIVTLK